MKHGGKVVIVISNIILFISTVLLITLDIKSSLVVVLVYVFIMGFGFGGAFTTLTIIVQESVEFNQRGVAMSTNSLLRTLGQTIGVSIFGSIFNLYIVKYFVKLGINGVEPSDLYKASSGNAILTNEQISLSLNSSLHVLFIIFVVICIVASVLSVLMPKIIESYEKR